ncbi:MAG: hypothetical protein PSU93_13965 [Methylobacter sp.]|uniref:Uncharacterized protein n=1 Tax=Candidatus Methylobacter titanis TaxID=3053457 RepID=A0AA43Q9F3_9GAMM|nr:hypothetical protein [Candidatus Methylobacter titanis]
MATARVGAKTPPSRRKNQSQPGAFNRLARAQSPFAVAASNPVSGYDTATVITT